MTHAHSNPVDTEKTDYDRFVILVCNAPSEQHLFPQEKLILEAMRKKWVQNHNDPEGKNFSVIYLQDTDKTNNYKFAPLSMVTQKSRIYIIGHCRAGSDCISNGATKAEGRAEFSYQKIGQILLDNISSPSIILDVDDLPTTEEECNFYPNTLARRLRICVPSCFSAGSETGDIAARRESFCCKLARYLFDAIKNNADNQVASSRVLICDVVGNTNYVIPVPLIKNPSIFEVVNWLLSDADKVNSTQFHKRHYHDFTNIFSGTHQPERNYKITFALPEGVTIQDIKDNNVPILAYGTKQSRMRLQRQIEAQSFLEQCYELLSILKPPSEPDTTEKVEAINKKTPEQERVERLEKMRHIICFGNLSTIPTWKYYKQSWCTTLGIKSEDELTSQNKRSSNNKQ